MNEKIILKMVRRCMNHLKRKDYELDITKADVERAVAITRISKGSGSWGSSDSINIGLNYWQTKDGEHQLNEYASYNDCSVIGGRRVRSREESYWIIVAHEVSHHVQYSKGAKVGWLKRQYRKPHGEGFRTIYAMLRSGLINPMLDSL